MAHAVMGAVATRLGRVVAAAELAMFALWVLAPGAYEAVPGGAIPTKPTTCLALLLLGVVLGWPRLSRPVRAVLLALVAGLALEGLVSVAADRPMLSAHPGMPDAWERATPDGSLQMAALSAICLLLLLASYVLGTSRRSLSAVLGLSAVGFCYVGALGHLYGVSGLHTLQTTTSVAVPTVVATLACAVAVLLHDDALPVPRTLRAPGIGGALVRGLLAWTLLVPPAVAWLVVHALRQGWIDAAFGLSLMALASAAGGVLLLLIGARTALRTDRAREAAATELAALNDVLAERVQAAVAEAEAGRERLSFLLDSTPVGIFETGPDGVRRYVNQRWRDLTGLVDDDVTGQDWVSVVHPDDRDRVARGWAAAMSEGREYAARYRYLRPDGALTWVDVNALALRGADGRVSRWLGSVTDVTDRVDAQARLAGSEQRHRSVVTAMAEGVVMQDATGAIVTANEAACRLLGLTMDQMMGRDSADPGWRAVREDGSDFPVEERPATLARLTGRSFRDVTMGVHRPDGTQVWLEVNSEPLPDPTGEGGTAGSVTTFADVTAARAAHAALRRSEEQFRTAMAHAPIGMALVELDGRFREVNRALCRIVGYGEDELVGSTFQQITHPDDLEADLSNLERLLDGSLDHFTMEKRYLTRGGEVVWVLLAVSLARDEDDRPAYFVSQVQDITDARAAKEQLAHRALHDPLTGLPNRDLLMDHLSHSLARSVRAGTSTAVMFCDLDHFKAVNDTHGHETGDLLLVAVAERLRGVVRPGDTVARLGGDEFVVVAEGLPDAESLHALAERVLGSLDGPLPVGPHVLRSGASIGVVVATAEDDARSVLRAADAAMYRAKALGRGRLEVSAAHLAQRPA